MVSLELLADSVKTKPLFQYNILCCKFIIHVLDQWCSCFVTFFITNIEKSLSSVFLSGNSFMNGKKDDWMGMGMHRFEIV